MAGHGPVAVRTQVFVEIAAVEIDEVIARLHHRFRDDVRGALGLRAAGIARVEAIHALAVDGVDVRHDLLERRHVDDRKQDERPGELGRADAGDQLLDRHDGRVL